MQHQHWKSNVNDALRAAESNIAAIQQGGKLGVSPLPRAPNAAPAMEAGGPAFLRNYTETMNQMRGQIKTLGTEVQLERHRREEEVQRVQQHAKGECAELREIIRQLQMDNAAIRRSISDLERRPAKITAYGGEVEDRPTTRFTLASATTANDGIPDLQDRVYELEVSVSRQQRVLDDRNSRLSSLVIDTVNSAVSSETEKIRSVAREAARDSTEDLIAVRSEAIQAMFADEMKDMHDRYEQAITLAKEAERAAGGETSQLKIRIEDVNARVDSMLSAKDGLQSASNQVYEQVTRQISSERERVNDMLSLVKGELSAQTKRQSEEALDLQQSLQLYITQRMEVLAAEQMSKADVQRTLSQQASTTMTEVQQLNQTVTALKTISEVTRQSCERRLDTTERDVQAAQDQLQRREEASKLDAANHVKLSADVEELRHKMRGVVSDKDVLQSHVDDCLVKIRGVDHVLETSAATTTKQWKEMNGRLGETVARLVKAETDLAAAKGTLEVVSAKVQNTASTPTAPEVPEGGFVSPKEVVALVDRIEKLEGRHSNLAAKVDVDTVASGSAVNELEAKVDAIQTEVAQHQKQSQVTKLVKDEVGIVQALVDEERMRRQEEQHELKMELLTSSKKTEERVSSRITSVQKETTERLEELSIKANDTAEDIKTVETSLKKQFSDNKIATSNEIREQNGRLQDVMGLITEVASSQQKASEEHTRAMSSSAAAVVEKFEKKMQDLSSAIEIRIDKEAADQDTKRDEAIKHISSQISEVSATSSSGASGHRTIPEGLFAQHTHSHKEFGELQTAITAIQRKAHEASAIASNCEEAVQSLQQTVGTVDERVTTIYVENVDLKKKLTANVTQAVSAEVHKRVIPMLEKQRSDQEEVQSTLLETATAEATRAATEAATAAATQAATDVATTKATAKATAAATDAAILAATRSATDAAVEVATATATTNATDAATTAATEAATIAATAKATAAATTKATEAATAAARQVATAKATEVASEVATTTATAIATDAAAVSATTPLSTPSTQQPSMASVAETVTTKATAAATEAATAAATSAATAKATDAAIIAATAAANKAANKAAMAAIEAHHYDPHPAAAEAVAQKEDLLAHIDDEARQFFRTIEGRMNDCEGSVQLIRDDVGQELGTITDAVKDVSRLLAQSVLSYVDALQGSGAENDAQDAALVGNMEDVFVSIVERSRMNRDTLDTVWTCLSESVNVMRRHESSVSDVIQAVVVQNEYVQNLAEALQLDPHDFALELNVPEPSASLGGAPNAPEDSLHHPAETTVGPL